MPKLGAMGGHHERKTSAITQAVATFLRSGLPNENNLERLAKSSAPDERRAD